MKILLQDYALEDLDRGVDFYKAKSADLGEYFLDSILSDIDSLHLYAGIHIRYYSNYYRLLSKRFPFAVYYKLEADQIIVSAVLDCRRDPEWIKMRLSGE